MCAAAGPHLELLLGLELFVEARGTDVDGRAVSCRWAFRVLDKGSWAEKFSNLVSEWPRLREALILVDRS